MIQRPTPSRDRLLLDENNIVGPQFHTGRDRRCRGIARIQVPGSYGAEFLRLARGTQYKDLRCVRRSGAVNAFTEQSTGQAQVLAVGQGNTSVLAELAPQIDIVALFGALLAQAMRESSSVNLQVTVLVISDLGSARKQTKTGGQAYGAYARYYNV